MKNFFSTSLIATLWLCSLQLVYSQTKQTSPAYVITSNQDTLHGTLNFADRERTPDQFTFQNGTSQLIYTSDDVTEVGIPGKVKFVSRYLRYHTNSDKSNELADAPDIIWQEAQVFLRVLISGRISLYEYTDANNKIHLVLETEDGQLTDLIRLRYLEDGNFATINRYRVQLKKALSACPSIFETIDQIDFDTQRIKDLMESYYECLKSSAQYISPKEKFGLEVALLAGLSVTRLSLDGLIVKPGSKNVSTELILEHILPRNRKAWSIITGIGYKAYEVPFPFFDDGGSRLNYLKLNTGFKRILLNKSAKVHLNAGFVNSWLLKKQNRVRRYEQGFYLGTGIIKDRWMIDLRFEKSNGFTPVKYRSTKVKTWFITAGYILYKNNFSR